MPRAIHWHNLDGSPIIVTENVFEYRRCISEHVRSDDVVAEVGCAEGLTTALLAQQAHRVGMTHTYWPDTAVRVCRCLVLHCSILLGATAQLSLC